MGVQDIEKEPLLLAHDQPQGIESPDRPQRRARSSSRVGLKTAILCSAIYGVYYATTATVSWATQSAALHAPRPWAGASWAFNAFVQHDAFRTTDLSGEAAEQLFLSTPSPESALAASRSYATHPHLAGSPEDLHDAEVILKLFQDELGIVPPPSLPLFDAGSAESRSATLDIHKLSAPTAWIDKYYPYMNTPREISLEILGDDGEAAWTADLVEDGDPRDPEAALYRNAVPTFHGYSKDGEAEGQLIYANYGLKQDYDELVKIGANLTGKIVLVRYGGLFRGLKILQAEELGAAGVLIYSDVRDDGIVTVEHGYEAYPAGPARNPTSVQRGSVQYLSLYPGDPTTPGYPAYENATRTEGSNTPKIPSLPISWANAQRLALELGGPEFLKITGKPSKRSIKLVNHVDDKVIPIWNTMAVIPGHIKNETVIVGCHRDAWVMGAADPTSGTVSLHEAIRGYGALLRSGWRPLRNILFASWDAEEYGLVGSTEWAEDFPEWISQNVVSYLNVDVSVSGSGWSVAASPSLAHLIRRSALDVPHPTDPTRTLWDARGDVGPYADPSGVDVEKAAVEMFLNALGSGSDYTPFLQHLGVASMDGGFGNTAGDAPYHYHSIYDSERWQELYGDPGFHRHVAVARHLGLTALRVADSIILPLNTTQYSLELEFYLERVEDTAKALSFAVDFTGLRSSIARLQSVSLALDAEKEDAEKKFKELLSKLPKLIKTHACSEQSPSWLPHWLKKLLHTIGRHIPHNPIHEFIKAAKRVQRVNAKLIAFERGFISEEGIKGREWYRHLVVAPGKFLGYGATTLPAVTESLTLEGDVAAAELEADRVADLINQLSEVLKV